MYNASYIQEDLINPVFRVSMEEEFIESAKQAIDNIPSYQLAQINIDWISDTMFTIDIDEETETKRKLQEIVVQILEIELEEMEEIYLIENEEF